VNRPRLTNRGLPRRVQLKHGAYYFRAPTPLRNPWTGETQHWIRLCAESDGESAMFRKLSELLSNKTLQDGTMPYLCAEWQARKLSRYSGDVRKEYKRMADQISKAFDDFDVAAVTTKICADFLRQNFVGKSNTARKYANVLRKMFRFAISELGLRRDNPCEQLDLSDYETKRREVLPAHAAVKAIRAAALTGRDNLPTESGPMFQCMIDLAYLVWQRGIDIRTLKEEQVAEGRIRFRPSKTENTSGKLLDVEITPQIQRVIDRARAIKRGYGLISPYLFPARKGNPYSKTGLHSMWRRAKQRAEVTDSIWFRDLRALGATDAAKAGQRKEEIQRRLAHTSAKTSEIYIKEVIPELSILDMKLPWDDEPA